MIDKIRDRKIVIVNQAANYLTIGFCNAFKERFDNVSLITGSIHVQGEELEKSITVDYINKYVERPVEKKFFSYLQACIRILWLLKTKYRKHEVFFVSLPPMGYLLNLMVKNKFSMVIWDVYPDVLKISGMREVNFIYRLWTFLNHKSFNKSHKLFTIGENIADLLANYIDRKRVIVQPLWSIFQDNNRVSKETNHFCRTHNLHGKFVVQYSGNIGLTHKVELIIELAELLKGENGIVFQIIGRGARVPFLLEKIKERKLTNCFILPFQKDDIFSYSLSAADLGVVVLEESVSKVSVPSKIYNLMSYGIPSLYFSAIDSELKRYADTYGHAKNFTENELDLAKEFILEISRDNKKWSQLSLKAEEASKYFKKENAGNFVNKYLN
jgi:hypothetical protein